MAHLSSIKDKSATARAWRLTKKERGWASRGGPTSTSLRPFWVDTEPSRSWTVNRYEVAPDLLGNVYDLAGMKRQREMKVKSGCARAHSLRGKCKRIVGLLREEQSLEPVLPVPPLITCGSLRACLRSMYPPELTFVQELSIKTSAKAEVQPCEHCEDLQLSRVDSWEKARLVPQEVCLEHLDKFARAFSSNVPLGWNKRKTVYVPNGHGTETFTRSQGGNWCEEPFSKEFRTELVYSAGKPRVVTLYSSYNVSVLTPLHNSLYAFLKGRNWLLVGSPTNERLRYLEQGTRGTEWLSFDYESATDNIKTAYVQRAVDVLVERGEGLSEEEVRCLRSLTMTIDDVAAESGQPMGSPMSFPLLCLINKTSVDMALTDLLVQGEISFKEWTSHRCLINGDDLLTKSTSSGCFVSALSRHGAQIGLRVNKEKTLRHSEYGEINSTVFRNCVEQKKTNVSALWMRDRVEDVLGFAAQACVSLKGFRQVVENNVSRLARQKIKTVAPLPFALKQTCLSSKTIKKALLMEPTTATPRIRNLLPVVLRPHGYDLTREEEDRALVGRVQQIRERKAYLGLAAEVRSAQRRAKSVKVAAIPKRVSLLRSLRAPKPCRKDTVLKCFALAWEWKVKERLRTVEPVTEGSLPPSDFTKVNCLVDCIKAFKEKRARSDVEPPPVPDWCSLSEYVTFE